MIWHGSEHGLDPNRIHVVGSSAGGHLTAMTAGGGWQQELGLPADVVKSAMPISGLFDLRPLVHTFRQRMAEPRREVCNSPESLLRPANNHPAVRGNRGARASGFHDQSRQFFAHWEGEREYRLIPNRNHFDVFLDLADPETALARTLIDRVQTDGH